jgi:hypothetical protein
MLWIYLPGTDGATVTVALTSMGSVIHSTFWNMCQILEGQMYSNTVKHRSNSRSSESFWFKLWYLILISNTCVAFLETNARPKWTMKIVFIHRGNIPTRWQEYRNIDKNNEGGGKEMPCHPFSTLSSQVVSWMDGVRYTPQAIISGKVNISNQSEKKTRLC